ncbi:hypothetical protein GOP47_0003025 [Adiantum capillus-veneris]|uniref:Uncharacterized protein n=1 Tax=Adiantum capillus-veneris TaxID=13818 RepID=A0A9D4VBQ4_ADICA|nr:hypothetical protein GOP47_0003025 [Adiantum capillus-veneris]
MYCFVDALIDTEDKVRVNPFPQQEPHNEEHVVPFLHITNLFGITPRFAIEDCVLNNYGTFKLLDLKIVKFFKADLVDSHNSDIVTVGILKSTPTPHVENYWWLTVVLLKIGQLSLLSMTAMKSTKSIKRDVDNGEVKTFVARNVGAFLGGENTLSVLDLTILVPVHSKRLQSDLLQTYKTQVESLCYGKQVFGVLHFSNINGVLLETLCATCKSNKVHKTTEGLFYITCQKTTTSYEIPRLQVKIKPSEGPVSSAQLVGLIVNVVLALGKTFQSLYSKNPLVAREILASTTRTGTFKISLAGNLTAFYPG